MLAATNELPQLSVIVTVGAGYVNFGFAVTDAGILAHPPTICDTVYTPDGTTTIDVELEPVLQSSAPVNDPAVNTELPQLSTADAVGVEGKATGEAEVLLAVLVHPAALVCVTL